MIIHDDCRKSSSFSIEMSHTHLDHLWTIYVSTLHFVHYEMKHCTCLVVIIRPIAFSFTIITSAAAATTSTATKEVGILRIIKPSAIKTLESPFTYKMTHSLVHGPAATAPIVTSTHAAGIAHEVHRVIPSKRGPPVAAAHHPHHHGVHHRHAATIGATHSDRRARHGEILLTIASCILTSTHGHTTSPTPRRASFFWWWVYKQHECEL